METPVIEETSIPVETPIIEETTIPVETPIIEETTIPVETKTPVIEETSVLVKEITVEEGNAYRAIEMWYNVVFRCQTLNPAFQTDNYHDFIVNVLSHRDIETITQQLRQVIADFYHYFYTQKHIAHLNHRNYELLTDEYANFGTVVRGIRTGFGEEMCSKEGKELINILIEISIYAFEKIIHYRKEWGLQMFEDEKQDEYIVKYYSDYDQRKIE